MATITKTTTFTLTSKERINFVYSSYALNGIKTQLKGENMDYLMNTDTGEIIEMSDIYHALNTLDFLLSPHIEIKY